MHPTNTFDGLQSLGYFRLYVRQAEETTLANQRHDDKPKQDQESHSTWGMYFSRSIDFKCSWSCWTNHWTINNKSIQGDQLHRLHHSNANIAILDSTINVTPHSSTPIAFINMSI
jgi:hypothetical protein